MKKNNKWFSIVYVFVIILFTLSIWIIVINKQIYYSKSLENNYIQTIWNNNLIDKSNLVFNYAKILNSSTWSYKDMLKCPSLVNYYNSSWSLVSTWITQKYLSWSLYFCSGSLNSQTLKLYYNNNYSSFLSWELALTWFTLSWTTNTLSWSIWSWSVSFSYLTWWYNPITKTWSFYDDSLYRRALVWYVPLWETRSIFYVNSDIRNYISWNLNNTWAYNKNIWSVLSWALFFDIASSWATIDIVWFSWWYYNSTKMLKKISTYSLNLTWSVSWYLQNNNTFSWVLTNAKYFDFVNNDYAIFLKSTWTGNYLKYRFMIFDNTWSWVYINPVDDYSSWVIKYQANDIFQNSINYILVNKEFTQQK